MRRYAHFAVDLSLIPPVRKLVLAALFCVLLPHRGGAGVDPRCLARLVVLEVVPTNTVGTYARSELGCVWGWVQVCGWVWVWGGGGGLSHVEVLLKE
jgi:hypothetical protein